MECIARGNGAGSERRGDVDEIGFLRFAQHMPKMAIEETIARATSAAVGSVEGLTGLVSAGGPFTAAALQMLVMRRETAHCRAKIRQESKFCSTRRRPLIMLPRECHGTGGAILARVPVS